MSFGMGVMENMVHTESSNVGSLSKNGNGSEEKLGGNVLQNGSYNTASTGMLKYKRRKVYAVRDFPPGCGTIATRLRSRMGVKTCQNGKAADDDELREGSCGRSFEAKVESLVKEEENLGQRDEQPCNDMEVAVTAGVESHVVNMLKQEQEPMKDELMYAPEDENFTENARDPVEVQPLSVCLPDGNGEHFICESITSVDAAMGSVGGQSIVTKQLHERRADVVRDFPSKTGTKRSNSVKSVKVDVSTGENLVLDKSDSGVSSGRTQNMVRDMVVYAEEPDLGRDHLDQSLAKSITTYVPEPLEPARSNGTVPKPIHVAGRKKAKKGIALHAPLKLTKISREYGEGSRTRNSEKNLYLRERLSPDIEEFLDQEIARHPQTVQVGIPPSHPSGSSSGDSMRSKVKETLRLFHGACRKILQEIEAKPVPGKRVRVDYIASNILKSKGKFLNTGVQIVGTVPGIEVGDEFQYRMELNILGIHKPSQGGIDYVKDGDGIIATSIVASGGYDDEVDNTGVMTYTGQGGNVIKVNKKGKEEKEPEDQQLITGNLALANSINRKNPVRVIRGSDKAAKKKSSVDARGRHYVYDGLYLVEEYWQETGPHGMKVFKYKLRRIPGQPELSWKVVTKSKKSKYREGLCRLDISEGTERLPICAVNEIDDEKPPMFVYTAKMIYPDWCRPIPPKACGCIKRCMEARNCACVAKNGGEIPYNHDGAVVDAKNLIYECGPLCKCPSSCYLRVTQHGIKFPLEIFKTESRGWGVRSLSSIPSGSFICEYVGELLEDNEAERRTGNDEYLFDIGNRYDTSLAEGMSKLMPGTQSDIAMEEETSGFTIDAAAKGNVGRFINHSCSPNLYAQNVLYDHEDTRIPHVMFFAMDNIPPLQELCYHYNYVIDQVRDSNGNVKKKTCHCGSSECTGRLY
ncbi:unnamed protein product [Arabis nemorensis]|uniref:Histone-lysine N-methyltransferase n=1 Tax=Arabis nemorensis TaxID=586526 RepID=A0A565C464_9BRAS|nr:unnamed protein product [Arabis nemorensis]